MFVFISCLYGQKSKTADRVFIEPYDSVASRKGALLNCPTNMKMHPILWRRVHWSNKILLCHFMEPCVHKSSYIAYVFHYKDIKYCMDPFFQILNVKLQLQ